MYNNNSHWAANLDYKFQSKNSSELTHVPNESQPSKDWETYFCDSESGCVLTAFNIVPVNSDIIITIRTTVFVKEPQRMRNFMHNVTMFTSNCAIWVSHWNCLSATNTSYIWRTSNRYKNKSLSTSDQILSFSTKLETVQLVSI